MWEYAKCQEESCGLGRYEANVDFCDFHRIKNVPNHCFLCEYAYQQCKKVGNLYPNFSTLCANCPAIWGSENFKHEYFCELEISEEVSVYMDKHGNVEKCVNREHSPIDSVINIRWKDEQ